MDTGGAVSYDLSELNSFATEIKVNITTTSSIPDENSSVSKNIKANDNTVFRGPIPTVFPVLLTPSVFEREATDTQETGYHVSLESNPVQGTMASYMNILSVSNLKLDIDLKRDNSGLKTVRRNIMNNITLVTSLLGSVFGIMRAISAAMKSFENKKENYKKAKQTKEKEKKKKLDQKNLKSQMGTIEKRKANKKDEAEEPLLGNDGDVPEGDDSMDEADVDDVELNPTDFNGR